MPAAVLLEAVRLAALPCEEGQVEHQAVKHLARWWDGASAPELRGAFGFALYVRHGDYWLSGNPEEGWVDAGTWAKCSRPRAVAQLLQGRITFVFFQRPVDTPRNGFDAKAVDGSEGVSGGKWPGITAEGIVTRYSHEALSLLADRFPRAWRDICDAAGSEEQAYQQGE